MLRGTLGDTAFTIALDGGMAAEIRDWLALRLPAAMPVHLSRIAGHALLMLTDLVIDKPAVAHDVNHIASGTWIFWPNRQILECILGEINPENNAVLRIGETATGLAGLREELGKIQRGEALTLTLAWAEPPPHPAEPALPVSNDEERRVVMALRSLRQALWAAEPTLVAELAARRGPMQPLGGLLLLEAIASRHQEALWHVFSRRDGLDRVSVASMLELLATSCADQIDGTLAPAGAPLAALTEACGLGVDMSGAALEATLVEAIGILGAIAHWADLRIPWPSLLRAMPADG